MAMNRKTKPVYLDGGVHARLSIYKVKRGFANFSDAIEALLDEADEPPFV